MRIFGPPNPFIAPKGPGNNPIFVLPTLPMNGTSGGTGPVPPTLEVPRVGAVDRGKVYGALARLIGGGKSAEIREIFGNHPPSPKPLESAIVYQGRVFQGFMDYLEQQKNAFLRGFEVCNKT